MTKRESDGTNGEVADLEVCKDHRGPLPRFGGALFLGRLQKSPD
jgi:hypothetical protein